MRLLVIGLGYSAAAVAAQLRPAAEAITATRRHAEGPRPDGIDRMIAFDGNAPSPDLADALAEATHLLLSAPPDEAGDPLLNHHREALEASGTLRWIGYLSTVGVYGDAGGGWVDERKPPAPSTQRSRNRLAAEDAWRVLGEGAGVPVAILRLAGIYGPGRSALDALKAGTARRIVKPGQVFNRIHRDDIAGWTARLAGKAVGGTFNLCDDEPAPPQDVVSFAARLAGCPVPEALAFEEAGLSPMGRSFYGETKRVSNRAIRQATGREPLYPSYREALLAQIREEGPAGQSG
ncbi:MAG: SDR family oxidoreductase [Hyphomicrobiaceae bacterium]|nr:SDR family oxidoreductase [Hyphomicrobiaceae bacterium]